MCDEDDEDWSEFDSRADPFINWYGNKVIKEMVEMGREITKMEDGKYKIHDTNEIVVEKKALEDAIANMEKQKVTMEENLKAINDELAKLRAVL